MNTLCSRKTAILFGFLLIAVFSSLTAQEITMPELAGYKKVFNYPVYDRGNLWDFIDGAADSYLAYGFTDLHVAEYKKGRNVIKLEIYRHSDNAMAFGIYSTERSSSFRFMNIGAQGYITGGAINFFKGNYYVKIRTYSKNEKTSQSAESLAIRVAETLNGDTRMPAVLSQFPETGKKKNEDGFVNESVLGHKFLDKAYKAVYEVGSDRFTIYILVKGSADEAQKAVDAYLKATGQDPSDSMNGKYKLADGYNGTIFLSWKENQIVIISGLSKDQSAIADQYTSEILK